MIKVLECKYFYYHTNTWRKGYAITIRTKGIYCISYAPWYLIVWRVIWFIPQVIASWILIAIVCIAWGPKEAKSVVDDIL